MAHLAGACGLATITIFTAFDPAVWHPRGRNTSLRPEAGRVDVPSLGRMIREIVDDQRNR
jgi:hypothetical protein